MKKEFHTEAFEILKDSFSILLEVIQSEDYDIRAACARALSKLKGPMSTDILLENYQFNSADEFLAAALGEVNPELTRDMLKASLSDPNPEIVLNAALALVNLKDKSGLAVLLERMEYFSSMEPDIEKPNEVELAAIIKALALLGERKCIYMLEYVLKKEDSPKILSQTLSCYTPYVRGDTARIVLPFLNHADSRVRASAVEALTNLGNENAAGFVAPYIDDENNRVKANVASVVYKVDEKETTKTLQEMAKSENKWDRASVAFVLGELNEESLFKKFPGLFTDDDSDVLRNVAKALRKQKYNKKNSFLLKLLKSEDALLKIESLKSLAKLGDEETLNNICTALESETDPRVISAYMSCIKELGSLKNINLIIPFLEHSDKRVISNALEAINKFADGKPIEEIKEKIIAFITDANSRLCSVALSVLLEWGEIKALHKLNERLRSKQKDQILCACFTLGQMGSLLETSLEMFERTSFEGAVEDFNVKKTSEKKALEMQKKAEEFLLKGSACLKNKKVPDAIINLKKSLRYNPKDARIHVSLADCYFYVQNFQDARKHYLVVMKSNPRLVKVYYNLGLLELKEKNYTASIKYLMYTLKLNPKLTGVYEPLASAFEKQGKIVEAVKIYQVFVKLNPGNIRVIQEMIRLLCEAKMHEKAFKMTMGALKIDAEDFILNCYALKYCKMFKKFGVVFQIFGNIIKKVERKAQNEELKKYLKEFKNII
ncbi:HEAT repeat domain-containing protein [Candidatus Riflebacteria bacterium]